MLSRFIARGARSLARVNSHPLLTSPALSSRQAPTSARSFFWFSKKGDDEHTKSKPSEPPKDESKEEDSKELPVVKSLTSDLPKAQLAVVNPNFRFHKGSASHLHQLNTKFQHAVFVYPRPRGRIDPSKAGLFRGQFYDVGFLAERPPSMAQPLVPPSPSTASESEAAKEPEGNEIPNKELKNKRKGLEEARNESWLMIQRVRVRPSEENPPNPAVVTYELLHDVNPPTEEEEADILESLRGVLKEFLTRIPEDQAMALKLFIDTDNSYPFGDYIDASVRYAANATVAELQEIVEELDLTKRAELVEALLMKELNIIDRARDLEKEAEVREMREATENLKNQKAQIEAELEKYSESGNTVKKFKARLEGKIVPENVMTVINEEFDRLKAMDPSSHEHGPLVDYLNWLTSLPWGIYTEDHLDIKEAKKVLDDDHYGLEDVKSRILEFIAAATLTGSVQGKILCLTGPPGTGKTSIARSIAKALGRKFYRFSVGGMSDPSEIKGHRRTYVASKAGKLIYGLKMAQSSNPVFLIDEIDKIERDPSSALLEALDPEQNKNFLDHYIDVPYDLSQVLFICTSNDHHRISPPLLDRMEVIEISGYVGEEKLEISKRCLIPDEQKRIGLEPGQVTVTDEALQALIKRYCPEPGVRTLKKHIQRIFARACLKQQESGSPNPIIIDEENVAEFVDEPAPPSRRYYEEQIPVGVSIGVAKTNYGGTIQYVESVPWLTGDPVEDDDEDSIEIAAAPSKDKKRKPAIAGGKLKVTGQTGDVMKESTQIALTFAKNFLATHQPSNKFFLNNNIHLHFPEGAMPKDGPSAGVTIVTSLLSLALDKPLAREIAMTGEVTLSGKILPVGGIKEKAIAAKIQGINEIVLPKQNETEWDLEIPDFVKENLTVHFVDNYAEMFEIVFGYHIHSIPLFDSRRVGGDFIIGGKQDGPSESPANRV